MGDFNVACNHWLSTRPANKPLVRKADECALDLPVFQRMEGDHRHPRFRREPPATLGANRRSDRLQENFECIQFVVDGDPECHEGPSSRVQSGITSARAVCLAHKSSQMRRRNDRLASANLYNFPRDQSREWIFTKIENHVGKIGLRESAQEIGGGVRIGSIEAHVEWSVVLESEPAFGLVQLIARYPEIREKHVRANACFRRDFCNISKISVDGIDTSFRRGFPNSHRGIGKILLVAVDQQDPTRIDRAGDRTGMTSSTRGGVDAAVARFGSNRIEDFGQQNWNMTRIANAHAG